MKVDREAFEKVAQELEDLPDDMLTFRHVGSVFGAPFWELIILALLDSQDAARAIQLASQRLRGQKEFDDIEFEDDDE